jgi:hypothetical protein
MKVRQLNLNEGTIAVDEAKARGTEFSRTGAGGGGTKPSEVIGEAQPIPSSRKGPGSRAGLFAELDRPGVVTTPGPNRHIWPTGKPFAPLSITTSRWTVIITAFPIQWLARSWRPATPSSR